MLQNKMFENRNVVANGYLIIVSQEMLNRNAIWRKLTTLWEDCKYDFPFNDNYVSAFFVQDVKIDRNENFKKGIQSTLKFVYKKAQWL
jgi:hypothetical protein